MRLSRKREFAAWWDRAKGKDHGRETPPLTTALLLKVVESAVGMMASNDAADGTVPVRLRHAFKGVQGEARAGG